MRYLLTNGDFDLVDIAGNRGHRTRDRGDWGDGNHRDVLLGFPVGGFDEGREHFSLVVVCSRSRRERVVVCSRSRRVVG